MFEDDKTRDVLHYVMESTNKRLAATKTACEETRQVIFRAMTRIHQSRQLLVAPLPMAPTGINLSSQPVLNPQQPADMSYMRDPVEPRAFKIW
jgi:hypothetical protein